MKLDADKKAITFQVQVQVHNWAQDSRLVWAVVKTKLFLSHSFQSFWIWEPKHRYLSFCHKILHSAFQTGGGQGYNPGSSGGQGYNPGGQGGQGYNPGDMCGDPECGLVCQGDNQCLQTGAVCVTSPCCPAHACSSTINKTHLTVPCSTKGPMEDQTIAWARGMTPVQLCVTPGSFRWLSYINIWFFYAFHQILCNFSLLFDSYIFFKEPLWPLSGHQAITCKR